MKRNFMKRIFSVALSAFLAAGMIGCGNAETVTPEVTEETPEVQEQATQELTTEESCTEESAGIRGSSVSQHRLRPRKCA